jgi:hypothetical protein
MANILFTSFYLDKKPERQRELEHCIRMNVNNIHIDKMVVLLEGKKEDFPVLNYDKIHVLEVPRPTFKQFFELANVMALKDINWHNRCLALSRWHYNDNHQVILHNEQYSQDVWIFKGKIRPMEYCDFYMGIRGCDNRIAYEIYRAGYHVINPAHSIRCIHYHMTEIRNYDDTVIPKPYYPIPVTTL